MAEDRPTIYVVATPIGNIDDLSPRAKYILSNVDIIAAEDTRIAKKLLTHCGISKKEIISYYDEVEKQKAQYLINRLKKEQLTLAIISDAGTPCVSDPGYRLIKLAHDEHIRVCSVPGPSALTSIVSVAGLPSDRFLFVGFLPTKKNQLSSEIQSWSLYRSSVVFFESTRRLVSILKIIKEFYPEAHVCVGRELTKLFEEIISSPIDEVIHWANAHSNLKGEAVVMVSLAEAQMTDKKDLEQFIKDYARHAFGQGQTLKDLLLHFKNSGVERKRLYEILLECKLEF